MIGQAKLSNMARKSLMPRVVNRTAFPKHSLSFGMSKHPLPKTSDVARLRALRQTALMDSSAEASFDRLTRLAARILGAPIALITLVDEDRQFFKSCVGLPEPWASRRGTPLSHSFCQHAIERAEPLIVADARKHPLVADNLAIRDLNVIAYAGIPLITTEGHALGSFCVIDDKPRHWKTEEVEILRDLAASVLTEIELRSTAQELERQSQMLSASEERFQLVARASNDVLWEYSWQTNTLWWSDNLHAFGYSPKEIETFEHWEEKVHPDDRERVVTAIRRTVQRGLDRWEDEYRFRRSDGQYAHVFDRGYVIYGVDGGPLRQIGSIMDITRRKRAETELQESQEIFRLLADNVREVFWISDPAEDKLVYANRAYEEIWGRTIDTSGSGRSAFLESVHPDDRARVFATAELRALGGYNEDYRIIRPGGEVRWIRDRGFPVINERGEVYRIVGIARDVTDRKSRETAQQLLAESGEILASSLDYEKTLQSVARLIVPTLADHCFIDVLNDAGEFERLEAAFAEPLPPELEDMVKRRYVPRWDLPHPCVDVVRSGEPLLIPEVEEEWLRRYARDAEHLQLLFRADVRSIMVVPLIARDRAMGALLFAAGRSGRRFGPHNLALAQEIASRAALAIDNARLYRQAEQATRAREDVLMVVSHELRHPLNAIHLTTQLLLDYRRADSLPTEVRKQLGMVRKSTGQMRRLVQDLLDVTRIEAGHLVVNRQVQDAAATIDEALSNLRPLAEATAVQVALDLPSDLPPILADRQRTVQALINLVTNALQHSPEGSTITLEARYTEDEIRFGVIDRGSGISEDQLPHLFNRFSRGANSSSSGVGLGLAITRGIVAAHGGRIWAESTIGQGSAFYFTLPRTGSGTADQSEAEEQIPPGFTFSLSTLADDLLENSAGDADESAEGSQRITRFLEELAQAADVPLEGDEALTGYISDQLSRAMHLGNLQAHDRLPSIRQLSQLLGVPKYMIVKAYKALETSRVVEKRERSGIFLAPRGRMGGELQGETARWVAEVVIGAWVHQIKIPQLPEIIRRFTSAVSLHCLCVESTIDHRTALAAELSQQFGVRTSPVSPDELSQGGSSLVDRGRAHRDADLLVTTSFHAAAVRKIAEELDKPMVVMTIHPEVIAAINARFERDEDLTVICVDRAFGERVRSIVPQAFRSRVQVIPTTDEEAISALDRSQPVLLTRAAREQLPDLDLRLIVPIAPSFSVETARDITQALVRLNMELGLP